MRADTLQSFQTLVTTHTVMQSNIPEDVNLNMTSSTSNSVQFKFATKDCP
jgi:hypothetical protein